MEKLIKKIDDAVNFIKKQRSFIPEVLIVTGTGLGRSLYQSSDKVEISYADIPHFPTSTVSSHAGELILSRIGNNNVALMRGRFHLYEAYSPQKIAFPLQVLKTLGVKTLILCNAAGGIGRSFQIGDLMLIKDHINLTGENPLVGPNPDFLGPRFPDMSSVYDKELIKLAYAAGRDLDIDLKEGVYVGLKGPSFETPAEVAFLEKIGGQAVGMSTVIEAIAGKHLGMSILGISTITNINDPEKPEAASLESIIEMADKSSYKLEKLLIRLMETVQ